CPSRPFPCLPAPSADPPPHPRGRVVRAARSHWTEEYKEYTDPHGKPFLWLTGGLVNEEPESTDTDLYWLHRDYATVVPATPNQTVVDQIPSLSGRYE
ncbi:MAG: 5'/3'-nucleotidase SurE, partial [Muribaculaceae bacterium]|nr:5'/3'-nucleotidase SurE [Muribaculaceae bacterium]